MGQPEEHQHLIGYEGEQRSSYREIPEDFLLYQCLLIDAMKKTFNQKLPIAIRAPFLKNLPRHRIFSTGEEEKHKPFCLHPSQGQAKVSHFHPHILISTQLEQGHKVPVPLLTWNMGGTDQPPQTPRALKNHLITCPNTKQYRVIPMAQTSKACRVKKA